MNEPANASIWQALSGTAEEAASRHIRSSIMVALLAHLQATAWEPPQAAKELGVSIVDIGDLTAGRLSSFTIDALVAMATKAGLRVEVTIYPADEPTE